MKLHTLELIRKEGVKDYGDSGVDEKQILNALVKFTENTDYKVYEHLLRREQENFSTIRYYEPDFNKSLKIPYCDTVYYLDIYYQ